MTKECKIWVVTYEDWETDPVVTVFDNYDAAEKCWKYFDKIHDVCILDECEIYSDFNILEDKDANIPDSELL